MSWKNIENLNEEGKKLSLTITPALSPALSQGEREQDDLEP